MLGSHVCVFLVGSERGDVLVYVFVLSQCQSSRTFGLVGKITFPTVLGIMIWYFTFVLIIIYCKLGNTSNGLRPNQMFFSIYYWFVMLISNCHFTPILMLEMLLFLFSVRISIVALTLCFSPQCTVWHCGSHICVFCRSFCFHCRLNQMLFFLQLQTYLF